MAARPWAGETARVRDSCIAIKRHYFLTTHKDVKIVPMFMPPGCNRTDPIYSRIYANHREPRLMCEYPARHPRPRAVIGFPLSPAETC
jgi:hypothetical protein